MNDTTDFQTQIVQECMDELAKKVDSAILWNLLLADKYPYSIKLPVYGASYPERYMWLNATVGPTDDWAMCDGKIHFKREEHLAWYMLRWS